MPKDHLVSGGIMRGDREHGTTPGSEERGPAYESKNLARGRARRPARTFVAHTVVWLLGVALIGTPFGSGHADILKNPKEIEPVTGATLGMGWDTTRKKLTNVCIDEGMDRLARGEVAVDTSPNIEEFSMARTATEMAEKMGLNLEIALSAITGIGRITNETKAGLLKQTESSQYSLTLVGRSRETVPEFLNKRGLRLKSEAESLLESELTHPQFRDRCGDAFILGWLKGHELVARLQITEEARERLREVDFENNLGIASGSYDIDTLVGVSKRSEMSSLRKTVDVKVFRTDSKRSRTDYSDPEAFKRAFFEWQSQVNPLDDGQVVALFIAPYRGNVPDYPPREYLAPRTAESYLGWIADALWKLKAAEEDAQYIIENPGRHALGVRERTRNRRLAAVRAARDAWRKEYERLKATGSECLKTLNALRSRASDDDSLPELPDSCVQTAKRYHFDRKLAAERDRIMPTRKVAMCGPTPISAVRGKMVDDPLTFDINLGMNVQPTGDDESNGNMHVQSVMVSRTQGSKLLTKVYARVSEANAKSSWKGQTGWFEILDLQEAGSGLVDKRNFQDCLFHEIRGGDIETGEVDGFRDFDWQHAGTPWGEMRNVIGWIDYEVEKGEKPPKLPPGDQRTSRSGAMLYEAVANDGRSLLHKIYCELDKRGGRERVLHCERIRLNPGRIALVSAGEYESETNIGTWSRPVAGGFSVDPETLRAMLSESLGNFVIKPGTDSGDSSSSGGASGSEKSSSPVIATEIVTQSTDVLVPSSGSSVDCADAVQGKIAWNHQGSKGWAKGNVDKLCGDAGSTAPADCFRTVMHSGDVPRSDGKRWHWKDALALCAETRQARRTIDCYRDRLRTGTRTNTAISACAR